MGSFLLAALMLTGCSEDDPSKRLAAQRILNYSDLPKAAENVGLRLSEQMAGNVDVLNRINEREVNMSGWLADRQGNPTPLNLFVFIGGSMVAATQTKGERDDVTKIVPMKSGAEKNVVFSLNFNCRSGDQPVIVGVGQRNQYLPLPAKQCP